MNSFGTSTCYVLLPLALCEVPFGELNLRVVSAGIESDEIMLTMRTCRLFSRGGPEIQMMQATFQKEGRNSHLHLWYSMVFWSVTFAIWIPCHKKSFSMMLISGSSSIAHNIITNWYYLTWFS